MPVLANVTDEELLSERRPAVAGDAFAEFYSRHERRILAYFVTRVGSPELAADLASETFAETLRSRRKFKASRGPAVGWLFGIARNVLASSIRSGQVEDRARRKLALQPVALGDEALAEVAALATGEALLEGLPREQAVAVRARVLEEQGYPEIARDLGCSEAVARQRVSRGLRALRQTLPNKDVI